MRGATGWRQDFFRLESFRVIVDRRPQAGTTGERDSDFEVVTEATVKLVVDGQRVIATAEGNGPVNALDRALREAIGRQFPALGRLHLTDYKVRVLDTSRATGAVTRVLIDSTNGERTWSTIGVSENVIEASWEALVDSIVYGLFHTSARAVG
jgi:2-isopropylmalate synthase